MRQKKYFLMMVVLLLAFVFAGCAGDTAEDSTADTTESESTVDEEQEVQTEDEDSADVDSELEAETDITMIAMDLTLVDESSAALSGYQLTLLQSEAIFLEAQSDESGMLTLENLPLGSTFDLSLADADGNEVATATISLLPGEAAAAAVGSDGTIELTVPENLADGSASATLQIGADGSIVCTSFHAEIDEAQSSQDSSTDASTTGETESV